MKQLICSVFVKPLLGLEKWVIENWISSVNLSVTSFLLRTGSDFW